MILSAVTIFLSAFLLFQVQPLIAKIILPWFGGSAAVWSAAMLFFQLMLLAGYGYAHWSIRNLSVKAQRNLHLALLGLSVLLLPILPSPSWKPTAVGDPTFRILLVLGATIGLPYFLLSSTSPLLQAWHVRRSGSGMPYRLFALSNFGSMLALLSFPFLVEPNLTSRHQAFTWSGIYAVFALLCGFVAWVSRETSLEPGAELAASTSDTVQADAVAVGVPRRKFASMAGGLPDSPGVSGANLPYEPASAVDPPSTLDERPRPAQMVLWVALAACASTLLVATTNHLSQNVAPIPLLWVVPLALYLGSFILAFESDRIYQRWLFMPWLLPSFTAMAYFIYADQGNYHIRYIIPAYAAGLFFCCMMCHGELALRKPAPRYLTLFYLMVSVGGAIGGLFVALIAPRVFRTYLELPVGLVACALLAAIVLWNEEVPKLGSWPLRAAAAVGVGVLAGYLVRQEYLSESGYHLLVRNFYGALRVTDEGDPKTDPSALRELLHGTISHGSQLLTENNRYEPTAYYGRTSGVGRAIAALETHGPVRIGSIGLGAGVLTAYGRPGDYYRIYEINPLVPIIAQTEFSFYPHSPADKAILMGDARLTLERQESQQFDLLSVDAFSSDAIPIHLLTREALELYFRHLKPDGILALHVSNRYLNLVPICAWGAKEVGKSAFVVEDEGAGSSYLSSTTWVLVSASEKWVKEPAFFGADITPAMTPQGIRPWTDDYSNVVQILKIK